MPAGADGREVAPTSSRLEGKHVPYGVAGIILGTGHVVCPECAPDELPEDYGYLTTADEMDAPGYHCADCERVLDTTVLLYDSGPGSRLVHGDTPAEAHIEEEV
jgi:hypothetical protein